MKCKRHPYEAGAGVCASCLRERLLDVLAAQTARPDPILFPSSLSPHRCSNDAAAAPRRHLLFFSTPQVAPSLPRRKRSLFSSLLFSHPRSEEPGSNPPIAKRSGAIYWISALIPRRRRRTLNTKTTKPVEASIKVCEGDVVSESGYSTETTGTSREAMPTPMRRRNQNRHSRGLSMCLSPLVRQSPPGRMFHAAAEEEVGFSGELRQEAAREGLGLKRSRLARFGSLH